MGWDIDVPERIYQRLANEIFFRVLNGFYLPGSKLPSLLEISKEAGSSSETVRKAIDELERNGIVNRSRFGNYITTDKSTILTYKEKYLSKIEKEYLAAKAKIKE